MPKPIHMYPMGWPSTRRHPITWVLPYVCQLCLATPATREFRVISGPQWCAHHLSAQNRSSNGLKLGQIWALIFPKSKVWVVKLGACAEMTHRPLIFWERLYCFSGFKTWLWPIVHRWVSIPHSKTNYTVVLLSLLTRTRQPQLSRCRKTSSTSNSLSIPAFARWEIWVGETCRAKIISRATIIRVGYVGTTWPLLPMKDGLRCWSLNAKSTSSSCLSTARTQVYQKVGKS